MNLLRRRAIERFGVEMVETDRISEVLDRMEEIVKEEERIEIHGYDHPLITLGQASLGLELLERLPYLETIIVAIGGGGLASDVAAAAKQINPKIEIFGVEPCGADSMYQSFKLDRPFKLPKGPSTIADSLSAPYAGRYSYHVCAQHR